MFIITRRIPSVGSGGTASNIISVNGICTWLLQLFVAMQMLMTLEIPLRTTMALPVTSKPIESTAENLAWQAWLMLPPEQKQLMKSRKVTPKSIFTLPLRMECPEGHQQVDSKCIPTVIGSNSVLIDPNVLGLVLGNPPTDIEYDYEDEVVGDDKQPNANNLPYNPPLYLSAPTGEGKAKDEQLQPPSQDAPLKFNIFQNKFPTDDYAMEDYSSMSNEGSGGQTQEIESNMNATAAAVNDTITISLNITTNITTNKDLVSEASNVSKVHSFSTLPDSTDFNLDDIDAISLPAFGTHKDNSHKISIFKEDSSLHLVTSGMETESDLAGTNEKDLETLLQTESLMPMINQSTTTPENLSITMWTTEMQSGNVSNDDEAPSSAIDLSVEGEELTTTLPSIIETETMDTVEQSQDKAEYIRSVTIKSFFSANDEDDGIEVTTLTPSSSYDEPSESESEKNETTTSPTIQLDETTIIEGNDEFSSLSTSDAAKEELLPSTLASASASESVESFVSPMIPPTLQPVAEELATLLLQQEQAVKDFEELQRKRKGQKDQHTVMKKSKVEPVEVLSTMPTATNLSETMPSEMTTTTTTATTTETETATVTPLLGVNNNNNNNNNNKPNDRFYYQHFAKQDLLERVAVTQSQQQSSSTTPTSTAWPTNIETLASTMTANRDKTSEIDLAQELRLINDLVKGNQQRPTKKSSASVTTTTTTAAVGPSSTVDGIKSTTTSTTPSKSAISSTSESSVNSIMPSRATAEIWSKLMPLLTTTTTPSPAKTTMSESLTESSTITDEGTTLSSFHLNASTPPAVVSNRSHRNSKIIRIDGFNTIQATPTIFEATPTKTRTTTTTAEDILSTTTAMDETSSTISSPIEDSQESFWWLPLSWRYNKPSTTTTTTTAKPEQVEGNSEDISLLLRFWSAYHSPKSS